MTFSPVSLNGFLIGLFIFTLSNLLAAPLLSDCGRPTTLRTDSCPDGIVHTGFPFIFFEEGGFVFRRIFNLRCLSLDIFIGFAFAVLFDDALA